MPDKSSHLGLYRAGLTSPAHRRHITVARRHLVADTLEILRGSASRKSKHHFLFIGPRGIGKTHLLHLVSDEIEEDPKLSGQYVVARFPEESHRVLSFADFLLRLCEILRDRLPDEPEWADLYERLHTEESDELIRDQLAPFIRKTNRAKKRTVLVMLENLNELFTRQIKNKKDLGALRKFFMDDNGCLLMATAPLHFDSITNVKEPFYDFFDVQILDHLSEEETLDLIRLNLEWDKHVDLLAGFDELRPKLLALYRMTGGNPRLTIMLYELIAHDSITKVREQFQILLDRISPFYQDRLSDLPPQERAVIETMAGMRDQEKTPAAIAARMRMSQPQTSALLKRLAKARYIRSSEHPADKRKRLYTIREGFFDIWLGMNVSRGARERIPYLLEFFTMFYPSREERNKKREELREKLRAESGKPDAEGILDYLTEVGDPAERAKAKLDLATIHATTGVSDKASRYLVEARSLSLDPVGRWIVEHATPSTDYLGEIEDMIECWDHHRSGDLEAFAQRLVKLGGDLNYKTFSQTKISFLTDHLDAVTDPDTRVHLRLMIASVLTDLAHWHEAEEQLRAAEHEASPESAWHPAVLYNLAKILSATNRLEEAEPMMRRTLQILDASFGEDHPNVAATLNDLSLLLTNTHRLAEAEPMMRRALQIYEDSYDKDHPHVAATLNNLATLLQDTNRLDEAEPMMRRALQIDEASSGKDHPKIAIRLSNRAQLLKATNRLDEAEPMMRRALQIDEASFGKDHPRVATDLNNLALLLKATNRLDEAEPMMRRALQIDEASFGKDHPKIATEINNLAMLLSDTKQLDEAEPMMRRALQIDEACFGRDHPNLARDLNNLATLLHATKRPDEAEQMMGRSFEILLSTSRQISRPHPDLKQLLTNYREILEAQGHPPEPISEAVERLIADADLTGDLADEFRAL